MNDDNDDDDDDDDDVAEMGSVNQVLMSVVQGVVEVQDPPSQRCCFCILKKLTEAWGKTGFCCFCHTLLWVCRCHCG